MALQDLPDNHDLNHLLHALKYVRQFRLALDVGAHRGIWARELKNHFDSVIAFEPVTELFEQLPFPAYNVAIGDRNGFCDIAPGPENTGQGHVVEGGSVEMRTLDSYPIQGVDFLKIDVEGYELFVLTGAEILLKRDQPVILLEKNGLSERYGVTDSDIDTYLNDLGYKHRSKWNKDHLYII